MEEGTTVYYLDEAVFSSKCYQDTEWSIARRNMEVDMAYYNIKCVAFMGVIALDKGVFHY